MKKNYIIDLTLYILLKAIGPLLRALPKRITLFLGRRIGDFCYYFDLSHRAIAYSNVKAALPKTLTERQICRIVKDSFRNFGQNIIEIFLLPSFTREYLEHYIDFRGKENIDEGFRRGKGVILLAVHAGNWELSNVICANLGFPFVLFVADQKFPKVYGLLNAYRRGKGCEVIERENNTRQLIETLKNNEAIGMTLDQGGKDGTLVHFLGREASMATGAVRLALKYGTAILPALYTRIKGSYHRVIIGKPFEIINTGDTQADIRENLGRLVKIYEQYILKNPSEYLWTYKIWKYAREKEIIVLSDGKAGHLRQAEAAVKALEKSLSGKDISLSVKTIPIEFAGPLLKHTLPGCGLFAGKYACQGCGWCLKKFLTKETYDSLRNIRPDVVISCGSSLAHINYVLSKENRAKSVVIMRPSIFSTRKFDLVIMPRHDNPPLKKNVLITEAALNLIDEAYLKDNSEQIMPLLSSPLGAKNLCLGLLLGGDTKHFRLEKNMVSTIIKEIKSLSMRIPVKLLATTSRRTPGEIEGYLKEEMGNFSNAKLLVIASENNPPATVGGILALSQVVIVSPESISMLSEAVSAHRYVVVFKAKTGTRHARFLKNLEDKKYIYCVEASEISATIERIYKERPPLHALGDNQIVGKRLGELL